MDDYMPEVCGCSDSTVGVCICRLATLPCSVYYGNGECQKKKSDKAAKCIGEAVRKMGEENE